ncbi:hypothetical protein BB559_000240 [Furculomyces boomerangus]|uniref:Uncharacterized protein n=1 Tax=Furculomyces boomerangus TaxID=61424 RepID=A0A2T9Z5W5_9FUNG|nr:hypothetical protein BB559_000240 [Furculomyces boomerangus]
MDDGLLFFVKSTLSKNGYAELASKVSSDVIYNDLDSSEEELSDHEEKNENLNEVLDSSYFGLKAFKYKNELVDILSTISLNSLEKRNYFLNDNGSIKNFSQYWSQIFGIMNHPLKQNQIVVNFDLLPTNAIIPTLAEMDQKIYNFSDKALKMGFDITKLQDFCIQNDDSYTFNFLNNEGFNWIGNAFLTLKSFLISINQTCGGPESKYAYQCHYFSDGCDKCERNRLSLISLAIDYSISLFRYTFPIMEEFDTHSDYENLFGDVDAKNEYTNNFESNVLTNISREFLILSKMMDHNCYCVFNAKESLNDKDSKKKYHFSKETRDLIDNLNVVPSVSNLRNKLSKIKIKLHSLSSYKDESISILDLEDYSDHPSKIDALNYENPSFIYEKKYNPILNSFGTGIFLLGDGLDIPFKPLDYTLWCFLEFVAVYLPNSDLQKLFKVLKEEMILHLNRVRGFIQIVEFCESLEVLELTLLDSKVRSNEMEKIRLNELEQNIDNLCLDKEYLDILGKNNMFGLLDKGSTKLPKSAPFKNKKGIYGAISKKLSQDQQSESTKDQPSKMRQLSGVLKRGYGSFFGSVGSGSNLADNKQYNRSASECITKFYDQRNSNSSAISSPNICFDEAPSLVKSKKSLFGTQKNKSEKLLHRENKHKSLYSKGNKYSLTPKGGFIEGEKRQSNLLTKETLPYKQSIIPEIRITDSINVPKIEITNYEPGYSDENENDVPSKDDICDFGENNDLYKKQEKHFDESNPEIHENGTRFNTGSKSFDEQEFHENSLKENDAKLDENDYSSVSNNKYDKVDDTVLEFYVTQPEDTVDINEIEGRESFSRDRTCSKYFKKYKHLDFKIKTKAQKRNLVKSKNRNTFALENLGTNFKEKTFAITRRSSISDMKKRADRWTEEGLFCYDESYLKNKNQSCLKKNGQSLLDIYDQAEVSNYGVYGFDYDPKIPRTYLDIVEIPRYAFKITESDYNDIKKSETDFYKSNLLEKQLVEQSKLRASPSMVSFSSLENYSLGTNDAENVDNDRNSIASIKKSGKKGMRISGLSFKSGILGGKQTDENQKTGFFLNKIRKLTNIFDSEGLSEIENLETISKSSRNSSLTDEEYSIESEPQTLNKTDGSNKKDYLKNPTLETNEHSSWENIIRKSIVLIKNSRFGSSKSKIDTHAKEDDDQHPYLYVQMDKNMFIDMIRAMRVVKSVLDRDTICGEENSSENQGKESICDRDGVSEHQHSSKHSSLKTLQPNAAFRRDFCEPENLSEDSQSLYSDISATSHSAALKAYIRSNSISSFGTWGRDTISTLNEEDNMLEMDQVKQDRSELRLFSKFVTRFMIEKKNMAKSAAT